MSGLHIGFFDFVVASAVGALPEVVGDAVRGERALDGPLRPLRDEPLGESEWEADI